MKKTDWELIRRVCNASLDLCQKVEELNLNTEESRGQSDENGLTVWDCLISSWTYPESLAMDLIRMRHQLNVNNPYVDSLSRTLIQVGNLVAQTVNAKDALDLPVSDANGQVTSLRSEIENYILWCNDFMPRKLLELAKKS